MRYFFVLVTMQISLFAVSAGITDRKVKITWETPASGSAVSYDSEEDFNNQPPLLFSEKNQNTETSVEIDLDMVGKGLILPQMPSEEDSQPEKKADNLGKAAARKAIEFFNKKIQTVNVNGSNLNIERDCAFFVRAAYWEASGHTLDLFRDSIKNASVNVRAANGVTLISELFRQKYRYQKANPEIGDIIVFDNTYDKNNNQKRDDYLTHVGIVTDIRADGTIEFYHGNIGRQVKKGFINFQFKNTSTHNGVPVNSYIRPKYQWESDSRMNLASYLVRAFAGY